MRKFPLTLGLLLVYEATVTSQRNLLTVPGQLTQWGRAVALSLWSLSSPGFGPGCLPCGYAAANYAVFQK